MIARVAAPAELDSSTLALWRRYADGPGFESPYFRPEFTQIVAAARPAVRVAVLEEEGRAVGFFPFERRRFGCAGPVGGPISDYQGVVHAPGIDLDAGRLLRDCGLRVFSFDHLLASQSAFLPFHRVRAVSPVVDLDAGFGVYRDGLRERREHLVRSVERKSRKLAREVGPLRFELSTPDRSVLERVLDWKEAQYRRSGLRPVVRARWVREVLERVHAVETPGFAGVLSALWAGDALVAAHFGMRSRRVLHWWFPTHAPGFDRFSPGLLLLWELLRQLEQAGATRLDLGKGDDGYKARFATAEVALAEGFVELPSLVASARKMRRGLEARARRGPAHRLLRPLAHGLRSLAARLRAD